VISFGYTGLEIAPFTLAPLVTDVSTAARVEIRQTLAAAGLDCIGLHWLLAKTEEFHVTPPDPAVRDRTVAHLGNIARLCADLGNIARLCADLGNIARLCADLGRRVLVFGLPKQRSLLPGVSHEQATHHLHEVFSRFVPVPVLESTGAVVASEPLSIPEIIHSSARHLEHFHANDVNLQGPGFEDVDFVPIFRAIAEARYPGWVSVGVLDHTPGAERLASDSIECMRRTASLVSLEEGE